ncbi:MAG: hypothetical protein ACE5EK_06090 [Nitrospinales bacterium]
MANYKNKNSKKTENQDKAPTHIVYHVVEYDNGNKANWTRAGAAWAHKDGEGFNVALNLFPVDGRLVIRTRKEDEESED